jgi:hypothetical protein
MKSGTTSLQDLLFAHRETLAGRGLLVPGGVWGDQARAVTEVARTHRADGELWSALAAEISAWPGPAVVSMEYLGPFVPAQVEAVVGSLAGARVEVVVTVRDLNRTLVSMWQETIQNGRSWTWAEYLAAARSARPRAGLAGQIEQAWRAGRRPRGGEAGRTFWKQQDVVAMVRRWGAAVGPDAVTVVTVPPPGAPREELTARFARAVGFSADELAPGESANASLGLTSAVLLQRVNAGLARQGIGLEEGKRLRKRVIAKQILGSRAAAEPRIGLPVARWVEAYAAVAVRRLAAEAGRLEGAWSDLAPLDVPGSDPAAVDVAALSATAEEAFAALRDDLAGRGVTGLPDWPAGTHGDAAVEALAGLVAAGVRAGVTV